MTIRWKKINASFVLNGMTKALLLALLVVALVVLALGGWLVRGVRRAAAPA